MAKRVCHSCSTVHQFSETEYVWKIDEFLLKLKSKKPLCSKKFHVPKLNPDIEWEVLLFFLNNDKVPDEVQVNLRMTIPQRNDFDIVRVNATYWIEDNDGNRRFTKSKIETFQIGKEEGNDSDDSAKDNEPRIASSSPIKLISIQDLLDDRHKLLYLYSKLTLCCSVKVAQIFFTDSCDGDQPIRDLGYLLTKKTFCDVKLRVKDKGEEFDAHRVILMDRSPFFKAMFEVPMLENESNCIEVDVSAPTVQRLLEYIYSGKLPDLETDDALELHAAADKYILAELKSFCEETVMAKIEVSNAAKLLHFADKYSADWLMSVLLKFMKRESLNVIKTPDWKELIHKLPHVMDRIILALSADDSSDDE